MPIERFENEPPPVAALGTPAEIRAYANPTRLEILRHLRDVPMTQTGTARAMGTKAANLAHHFRILAEAGLIRLVEKRDTGRNLEKYFRAVARTFVVRPQGIEMPARRELALAVLRDDLACALARESAEPSEPLLASLRVARIDPVAFAELRDRLEDLARDFAGRDQENGTPYALNVSLYPSIRSGGELAEVYLNGCDAGVDIDDSQAEEGR